MVKDWINKFIDALYYDQGFAEKSYRRDSFWRMMVNQLARDNLITRYIICDNIPEAIEFFDFIEGNGFKTKIAHVDPMGHLIIWVKPLIE